MTLLIGQNFMLIDHGYLHGDWRDELLYENGRGHLKMFHVGFVVKIIFYDGSQLEVHLNFCSDLNREKTLAS